MISGAAFIRNGIKYCFPFMESIRSLLPICGEVVVAVGRSEDGTREKLEALKEPKIRIIDTVWDETKRKGGEVLSEQTNISLDACKGDWIFYLQSDEVVHEADHAAIFKAIERYSEVKDIDALAFKYRHFYGSYWTVQEGRHWYPEEVRIIRNKCGIKSFGDAQGFRKDGRKVKAALIDANIYHYGWARPPAAMAEKIKSFHKLWHDDVWVEKNCTEAEFKAYYTDLGNLESFEGTHPAAMQGTVNDDTLDFIRQMKKDYLLKRDYITAFRDMIRTLPVGKHRNFKLVKRG